MRHVMKAALPIVLLALAAPALAQERVGILLLAHGGASSWNERVSALATKLDDATATEVAFGMASRPTIQTAIDRLIARKVTRIVAVPLFISSHSSVIRGTEFLLNLRATAPKDMEIFAKMSHGADGGHHGAHADPAENMKPVVSSVPITMTAALDRHPVVAAILAARAAGISSDPAKESIVIVAHGPSPEDDNNKWLADMAVLAQGVRAASPYRTVDYLTVRDDAPDDIRNQATSALRALVESRTKEGSRVLIVPLLMSFGGIEQGIVKRLAGLSYVMAQQGLMPDDRLLDWVRDVARR